MKTEEVKQEIDMIGYFCCKATPDERSEKDCMPATSDCFSFALGNQRYRKAFACPHLAFKGMEVDND